MLLMSTSFYAWEVKSVVFDYECIYFIVRDVFQDWKVEKLYHRSVISKCSEEYQKDRVA